VNFNVAFSQKKDPLGLTPKVPRKLEIPPAAYGRLG